MLSRYGRRNVKTAQFETVDYVEIGMVQAADREPWEDALLRTSYRTRHIVNGTTFPTSGLSLSAGLPGGFFARLRIMRYPVRVGHLDQPDEDE